MSEATTVVQVPTGALVVLVAPSGAGKSTWANDNLGAQRVVSSDQLRGVISHDEHDQRASKDAFDLLERIVAARLGRGLSTVVDSTALEAERRARYRTLARQAGVPCHAIVLDLPQPEVKARNRARARAVPAKVVTAQWQRFAEARAAIPSEGFDGVHVVTDLATRGRWVGPDDAAGTPDQSSDRRLQVHLHLARFDLGGESGATAAAMRAAARTAEEVGFAGIWLMDHLQQIPQVGRAWDDLPEAWTSLAWLAATTSKVRLGSLVTPVTLRPLAVLAKTVATVDALSGGRVTCGLGLGWFKAEHLDLGVPFPDVDARYALLEDHLRGLPVLWGAGQKAFDGNVVTIRRATVYPRPVQDPVPLLVGGNGPRRTLRLAAEHADAVNLQGTLAEVQRGVVALHEHLGAVGRHRDEVRVTARVNGLCRPTPTSLDAALAHLAPAGSPPLEWGALVGAGTVEDHVGRLLALAEVGVEQVMVSVHDADPEGIAQFARVIDAVA